MKLKFKKISGDKIIQASISGTQYLKITVVLIGLGITAYLISFLYQNLYLAITQSDEIILLKQEVAPETIDIDEVDQVLNLLDKKTAGVENKKINQANNPFIYSFNQEDSEPVPEPVPEIQ